MGKTISIGGLTFESIFCKKINANPIPKSEVSLLPSTNIYNSEYQNKYVVNIFSFIPEDAEKIENYEVPHLQIDKDHKIFFTYEGVSCVKTSINKQEGVTLCRNFCIDYNSVDSNPEKFNLFHIQIAYEIKNKHGLSVEAVIVHDKNLDPETDRGTVTTVRTDVN